MIDDVLYNTARTYASGAYAAYAYLAAESRHRQSKPKEGGKIMPLPYSYDSINAYQSQIQPGTIRSQDTATVAYFRRYLFDRAISVFKWKIPESWNKTYFLYSIYGIGFIAVINTDKFGIIPQHGTLGGRGVFYQPTNVCIANPLFNTAVMPKIGVDCEIIKLRPDYCGILDLVND